MTGDRPRRNDSEHSNTTPADAPRPVGIRQVTNDGGTHHDHMGRETSRGCADLGTPSDHPPRRRPRPDLVRVPGDRGSHRRDHRRPGRNDEYRRQGLAGHPRQDYGHHQPLSRVFRGEEGQTVGIYIVAVAALFFLAFVFFAVGQASVTRNAAQTAADASALAAARDIRDQARDGFLKALESGDVEELKHYLDGEKFSGGSCSVAGGYADDNKAALDSCLRVMSPPGYTIGVHTKGVVGHSVVDGTDNMHAKATATAVVESRCDDASKDGVTIRFSCSSGELSVDPTVDGFELDLSNFFSVHLSK